ncbi:hypothetical protein B0J12DRAFT_700949 [Macrophomina phaseolina]|uniref:Uncharacterized protein n=1 Tax=Macrophomina phaseolina TaxID=35725 RepID=A0ABQ8G5P9_9PEZI|nr:hypothetical protein B0J12DRAFT_700949 [Macrophomina phaseolina]
MRVFIEGELSQHSMQLELLEDANAKEKITETIQEKANGVFLVMQRLRNRASLVSIEEGLGALPDELGGPNGLYALMLLDHVAPEDVAEGLRMLSHISLLGSVESPSHTLAIKIAEHLDGTRKGLAPSMRKLYPLLLPEDELARRNNRLQIHPRDCAGILKDLLKSKELQNLVPAEEECLLRDVGEATDDILHDMLYNIRLLDELYAQNAQQVRFMIIDELYHFIDLIRLYLGESEKEMFGNAYYLDEWLAGRLGQDWGLGYLN